MIGLSAGPIIIPSMCRSSVFLLGHWSEGIFVYLGGKWKLSLSNGKFCNADSPVSLWYLLQCNFLISRIVKRDGVTGKLWVTPTGQYELAGTRQHPKNFLLFKIILLFHQIKNYKLYSIVVIYFIQLCLYTITSGNVVYLFFFLLFFLSFSMYISFLNM